MSDQASNLSETESVVLDFAGRYNQGLTPLHRSQKSVIRIAIIIPMLLLVLVAVIVGFVLQEELGIDAEKIIAPVAIFAVFMTLLLPHRKYRRWGYDMGEEQLRVLRGFMWRTDTIVPFNRIQHIDVAQGPLQRMFGLSRLIVHTAGTHNSIVTLPGLATADAEAMRETIKTHIRQDMI